VQWNWLAQSWTRYRVNAAAAASQWLEGYAEYTDSLTFSSS
jgi:hypothetical protein